MVCLRLEFQLFVIAAIIYLTLGLPVIRHENHVHRTNALDHNALDHGTKTQDKKLNGRIKRQLDVDLSVDHEQDVGTDFAATLSGNIWKSEDGKSRLDGNAKYNQHFSEFGNNGNAKIGGGFHFMYNY